MYDEYDDDYRNADRDHRTTPNMRPTSPSRPMTTRPPAGSPAAYGQVAQPPAPYGQQPAYPAAYGPPAYPVPYGQPYPAPFGYGQPAPYGYGYGYPPPSGFKMETMGRVLRAATPLVVALLGLPTPPTPLAATGDTENDVKAALVNQANTIAYQTALAETEKRGVTVFAIGEGLGLLMEKGLS